MTRGGSNSAVATGGVLMLVASIPLAVAAGLLRFGRPGYLAGRPLVRVGAAIGRLGSHLSGLPVEDLDKLDRRPA